MVPSSGQFERVDALQGSRGRLRYLQMPIQFMVAPLRAMMFCCHSSSSKTARRGKWCGIALRGHAETLWCTPQNTWLEAEKQREWRSPENHRTKWRFIAGKKSSIATLDYLGNLSDRQLPGTISSGKPTPPPQTYSTTTTITMTIISSIRLDEMKVKVNMKNMMLALVCY